jgi:hypothetical protein
MVNIAYSDMSTALVYRVAFLLLNVCEGDHSVRDKDWPEKPTDRGGRDLSSLPAPGSKFGAVDCTLVPLVNSKHPWDIMKPGDQGTKK